MTNPEHGGNWALARGALVVGIYVLITMVGGWADPGPTYPRLFAGGLSFHVLVAALLSPVWFGFYYHGQLIYAAVTITCLPLWIGAAYRWDKVGGILGLIGGGIWIITSYLIVAVI